MSSAVAELDNYLQSMLALKAPGVSGSKINSITSLCTANVQVFLVSGFFFGTTLTRSFSFQNESVLIQKIYTHFKKTPGTHKLGVLYVVDSVTRQWVDAARKAGQPSGSAAPDGTFAAGVNRVTELLPVLMADIINNAPDDQKVRFRCICANSPLPIASAGIYIRPETAMILLALSTIRLCPIYIPLYYSAPFLLRNCASSNSLPSYGDE